MADLKFVPFDEMTRMVKRLTKLLPIRLKVQRGPVLDLLDAYQGCHTATFQRMRMYRVTCEFLMTTRRDGDQWIYLDGEPIEPPEEVKFALAELDHEIVGHRQEILNG